MQKWIPFVKGEMKKKIRSVTQIPPPIQKLLRYFDSRISSRKFFNTCPSLICKKEICNTSKKYTVKHSLNGIWCPLFYINKAYIGILYYFRTKWKRQTSVGLELLAEAGNYAAVQRLYGNYPYNWPSPSPAAGMPYPAAALSTMDMYYRQLASGAAGSLAGGLQKPLPYKLYPPSLGLGALPNGLPSNPLLPTIPGLASSSTSSSGSPPLLSHPGPLSTTAGPLSSSPLSASQALSSLVNNRSENATP